jgi:hypothetical protein
MEELQCITRTDLCRKIFEGAIAKMAHFPKEFRLWRRGYWRDSLMGDIKGHIHNDCNDKLLLGLFVSFLILKCLEDKDLVIVKLQVYITVPWPGQNPQLFRLVIEADAVPQDMQILSPYFSLRKIAIRSFCQFNLAPEKLISLSKQNGIVTKCLSASDS